jgi:surface-anchored protein
VRRRPRNDAKTSGKRERDVTRPRIAILVYLGCGALLASLASSVSVADEPIYRGGHADVGPTFFAGPNVLELHYRFGSDATTTDGTSIKNSDYAPAAIVTRIPNPPFARPEGEAWDFTGVAEDEPIWYAPQTQSSGRPFLGFATDDLEPAEWSGPVTWSLEAIVSAPLDGHVSLWQSDFFGNPSLKFASADGIDEEDAFPQGTGGHDHYNWGFSRPGVYEIEISAAANRIGLGQVSGSGVFTFLVGIVDGDYNRDGAVDAVDYTVWRNALGTNGSGLAADGNNNQSVDAADYTVWKTNYGNSSPTSAGSGAGGIAAVPEPASIALLLSVFALTGVCRRALW